MADRTSSRTVIEADKPTIAKVIADFAKYPEWAEGITAAEILSTGVDGRAERVRMTLEAGPIKDTYVLAYDWDHDDEVHWRLAERGATVTGMSGAYRLTERDGVTDVTYELAVDVRVPMIGMVRRTAEKRIVDTALRGLKRRVEGVGGAEG